MPLTDSGAARLAAELGRAHELVEPPALVWLWDAERFAERRGALYAWRGEAPPYALVVWHEPGPVDRVAWVCGAFVRTRHE